MHTQLQVLSLKDGSPANHLNWHKAFHIDQSEGSAEMRQLMETTTAETRARLRADWLDRDPITAADVYSMQLLHCYDIVSGRTSPFDHLFNHDDWVGFEYLRDTKYFFSEGYGRRHVHLLAVPWLESALASLRTPGPSFPLEIAFTHREEVLYLCCLLGINSQPGWTPPSDRIDTKRSWRVGLLAPYLGHVGLEAYRLSGNDITLIRVIVNGEVRPAFHGDLASTDVGGYKWTDVSQWVAGQRAEYDRIFGPDRLHFLGRED